MDRIISRLKTSKKPLILAGSGVLWGHASLELKEFINKNNIPIVTTYHSKGIVSEFEKLNLGMVGIRGTNIANYAFKNSDLILVLGAKLSDRTSRNIVNQLIRDKLIIETTGNRRNRIFEFEKYLKLF